MAEIDDIENLEDPLCDTSDGNSPSVEQIQDLRAPTAPAQIAIVKHELVELAQQPAGLARVIKASTSNNAASSPSHRSTFLTVLRHLPDGSVMHSKLTFVGLKGKRPSHS